MGETRTVLRAVVVAACLAMVCGGCPRTPEPSAAPPASRAEGAATPRPYPMTVTDDFGEDVTFDAAPKRIVSMSPPLTETLFALGLGNRVVGVTSFCDYPPEAKDKAKIGGIIDPSEEKIVALAPDLVIAAVGNPKPTLASLRGKGINVFAVASETWDDVVEGIGALGKICGVAKIADAVAGDMTAARESILSRVPTGSDEPSVLFSISMEPLYVAGPGTYISDMIEMCGAVNIVAETENPWKQYSVEMAVAADPDVILMINMVGEGPPDEEDNAEALRKLRADPQWKTVSAVKNGRVAVLDADLVARSGPRLADGLREMAAAIWPATFAEGGEAPAASE